MPPLLALGRVLCASQPEGNVEDLAAYLPHISPTSPEKERKGREDDENEIELRHWASFRTEQRSLTAGMVHQVTCLFAGVLPLLRDG